MALYNAFRYNYSDVEGCSLIIDVGARTTNLVFIETNKVFSRSISSGGNTITAAIAKEFGEPFGAAEERKKRDGFVSLGGAYADPDDPDVARVSKITRNTMTRLHAEIARSVSFYRSQQAGAQPARVYLAGATTSMPYMREFFQEKFQMPVEFFNPLRNVTVSSTLSVDEIGHKAHTLGGLVGLALRSVSSCPMELNLEPAGVIRRQRAARQKPAFVLAALCLLAALAAWWLYYDKINAVTAEVNDQQLASQISSLQDFEKRMNATVAQTKQQQEAAAPLLQAVHERDYWARIINDINARLPKDFVWITAFEPQIVKIDPKLIAPPGGAAPKPLGPKTNAPPVETPIVMVHGFYLANPRNTAVVDEFQENLGKSTFYSVGTTPAPTRSVPNENDWAFDYSFPLVLKEPIAFTVPTAPRK